MPPVNQKRFIYSPPCYTLRMQGGELYATYIRSQLHGFSIPTLQFADWSQVCIRIWRGVVFFNFFWNYFHPSDSSFSRSVYFRNSVFTGFHQPTHIRWWFPCFNLGLSSVPVLSTPIYTPPLMLISCFLDTRCTLCHG